MSTVEPSRRSSGVTIGSSRLLYASKVLAAAQLKSISVQGLFGRRDIDITMADGAPTILTGGNGTGKSTILRLVNALSAGDTYALMKLPLDSFQLKFHSHPSFRFARAGDGEADILWGKHKERLATGRFPDVSGIPPRYRPFFALDEDGTIQLQEHLLRSLPTREYNDLMRRAREWQVGVPKPQWLSELSETFPVLFVTDQRLIVDRDPRPDEGLGRTRVQPKKLAVEAANLDIAARMKQADTEYAQVSQTQDRNFPLDVINMMTRGRGRGSSIQMLDRLDTVDAERQGLRRVGLLETHYEDIDIQNALTPALLKREPSLVPVMDVFLKSALVKLDVYRELAERLTPFKDFLDRRFKGKELLLSRNGLRFRLEDSETAETIGVEQLSSGEQQLFVLAYEILFRTAQGTLVIIDEPEISLHVVWQASLVNDLVAMGMPSQLQFLMATHSPVIAAENRKSERSLDLEEE